MGLPFIRWFTFLIFAGVSSLAAFQLPLREPVSGFGLTNAFPGLRFDEPVCIVSPPGETNRLFIVEKIGRIIVLPDLRNPVPEVFLDLRSKTFASTEGGLLSLAFHPDYAKNGRFFVYRTAPVSGFRDLLAEFKCDPPFANQADAESEKPIIGQVDASDTHNAGGLAFGPDGYLYLSLGDEGPVGDDVHESPQAIDKGFFGGIIRIDVDGRAGNLPPNPHPAVLGDYLVPADNPFVGATEFDGQAVDPARVRTEFFAVGMRNPWRFTFDTETGQLICADVGAGNFEEIDLIEAGGNYGWPYMEGDYAWSATVPQGLKPPRHVFNHGLGPNDGSCGIGGLVYRGRSIPSLAGQYIFGDYISGNIWALNVYDPQARPVWLTAHVGLSSFGLLPSDGSILVANHLNGTIEKLVAQTPESPAAPKLLSDVGAFTDLATLTPVSTSIPFEVITPLWSDGAIKQRWVDLSASSAAITFSSSNAWELPPGAAWVKHFELELTNGVAASRRRIETRFLVKTEDGIYGLTYRWGDSRTNAVLVPAEGTNETFIIHDGGTIRTQVWNYPSRDQCRTCHNERSGWVLGFNGAQLNREITLSTGETNQLDWLAFRQVFKNPGDVHSAELPNLSALNDSFAPAQHKVRSYLQSNCVHCHQPGAISGAAWDARISTALSAAKLVDAPASFYPPPMKVIDPRVLTNSFLYSRVSNRIPGYQMPPLATTVADQQFIRQLETWIESMPADPWISTNIGFTRAEGAAEQFGDVTAVYSASRGVESDSVFYFARSVTGSFELVTRLNNLTSLSAAAEAGLMLRSGLGPNEDYAAVTLKNGAIRFTTCIGTHDSSGASFSVGGAASNIWFKLVAEGKAVSAWEKSGDADWRPAGGAVFDSTLRYAGFCAASGGPRTEFAAAMFDSTQISAIEMQGPAAPSILLPQVIPLAAVVSPGTTDATVEFYGNDQLLGVAVNEPWQINWSNAPAGTIGVRAVLRTTAGSVTSAPVTLTLEAPAAQAWINPFDTQTLGDYRTKYGQEFAIAPGITGRQSTNIKVLTLNGTGVVLGPSTNLSALRTRTGVRIASLYTNTTDLELRLSSSDYQVHRGALYFVNWSNLGSVQQVSFYPDGSESPEISTNVDCTTAVYLSFAFRNGTTIRIHNPAGPAYFSGIFGDSVAPITVELLEPDDGLTLNQPASVTLRATASAPDREVVNVEFRDGSGQVAVLSTPPWSVVLTNVHSGTHLYKAVAYGTFGISAESEPATVYVSPVPAKATFVGVDTNTFGSWTPHYGADGYLIVGDATVLPPFVSLNWDGGDTFLFAHDTEEIGAPQRASTPGRTAAALFAKPEFAADVSVLDAKPCSVGFYFLDWGDAQRGLDVVVEDSHGNQLDRREVRSFASGKYFFWEVEGDVRFRFISQAVNAVVSGVFFDRGLGPYQIWRNNLTSGPGAEFNEADADGDGVNNATEYYLGYDPFAWTDKPTLNYALANGSFTMTWSARSLGPGVQMRMEASSDLIHWEALNPQISYSVSNGRIKAISFRAPAGADRSRFFRIRAIAQ